MREEKKISLICVKKRNEFSRSLLPCNFEHFEFLRWMIGTFGNHRPNVNIPFFEFSCKHFESQRYLHSDHERLLRHQKNDIVDDPDRGTGSPRKSRVPVSSLRPLHFKVDEKKAKVCVHQCPFQSINFRDRVFRDT